MIHSRLRWAKLNRDKDISKSPRVTNTNRKNPKRKSKPKGTKTRDKKDPDTVDVVRDKDLKTD
jgi:hypothetical protein